jgi:hypothetical protein
MATTSQMRSRLASIDVNREVAVIILADPDPLLDLNREQLMEGFDADGKRLPPYRSKSYADFKHNVINAQAGLGNPDYYLTGATHAAMFLRLAGNRIEISSTTPQVPDLLARNGRPFGLNDTAKSSYVNFYLQDALLKRIKYITGTK